MINGVKYLSYGAQTQQAMREDAGKEKTAEEKAQKKQWMSDIFAQADANKDGKHDLIEHRAWLVLLSNKMKE